MAIKVKAFPDGAYEGVGKMTYANGDVYEGYFSGVRESQNITQNNSIHGTMRDGIFTKHK